jgi:arginyl-tRNA synthetase
VKDYVFSIDRMLAFEGNTGPYLLYALVRIKSIFRKAKERGVSVEGGGGGGGFSIAQPQEKMLALALLRYPGALKATGDACEPHRLCTYLYELAGAFSSFFDACPVLAAPDEATMRARLRLCALTGKVLEDGLKTLGIPVVERM